MQLPRDLRGFFPEAEKVADMAKPKKNGRLAGAANTKSETVIWDDVVPKLGLRDRLGRSTWIVQWRANSEARKQTLGSVAELDRKSARHLATEILNADDMIFASSAGSTWTLKALKEWKSLRKSEAIEI